MSRVFAADDKEEKDKKEETKDTKKEEKPTKEKEPKKDNKEEKPEENKEEKVTPKNYFKINTNFKFEAIVNNFPIKELTIKEPGKKGLLNFLKQAFIELKNRKAPVIVARMDGSALSVNPIAPIEKQNSNNITPRGYILGVLSEFTKLGIKYGEFVSLYDYTKGKLNNTVSEILEKKITVSNFNITEIEGVDKLSKVIPIINSDKRLQKEMQNILNNYNRYVSMYYNYLKNIVNSKFEG